MQARTSQTLGHRTQLSGYELLCECRDELMQKVVKRVNICAKGRAVLLSGPTGAGKEVLAQALHERGDRSRERLVTVDCANLGADIMRSELFGHEKGAFTGATERKIGLFEAADKGTAFLDEIGEIPLIDQSRLLRVLQGLPFNRVGGNEPIQSDFNLIAATNRNLGRMVREGTFRTDLYYRINVFNITLPSLKERQTDIVRLANFFVDDFSKESKTLSAEAEAILQEHTWPGNVRELKDTMERAVAFAGDENVITKEHIEILCDDLLPQQGGSTADLQKLFDTYLENVSTIPHEELMQCGGIMGYAEKLMIQCVLRVCSGNKFAAAEKLGIGRQTLYNKIQTYGISVLENQ